MPEAPEVKLMTRSMSQLVNQTIVEAKILNGKYLNKSIPNWDKLLFPLTIKSVGSKGKLSYLLFTNGMAITIGFGMTGKIHFQPDNKNHIQLICQNGMIMCFDDYRRFGNWNVYLSEIELQKKLDQLGIDLLETLPEASVIIKTLRQYNRWNICKCLMNQEIFSGIGNYIKCESLYREKIDPLAKVCDLTDQMLVGLLTTCHLFALQSYQLQLDGDIEYRKATSQTGDILFHVYGRTIDPYGNQVKKIKTPDGRMTSYVPKLQTLPENYLFIDDLIENDLDSNMIIENDILN